MVYMSQVQTAGQVHDEWGWGVAELSGCKCADVAVAEAEEVVGSTKSVALHQLPTLYPSFEKLLD